MLRRWELLMDDPDETQRLLSRFRRRRSTPAQLIALSFAVTIALGTVLLALPAAHAPGHPLGVLDALFTATSAVCVTGLVVVQTGSAFSLFGKLVIMLLIQAGGLGILTLGTLVALASGRRIGFRERLGLQAQVNIGQVGGIVKLVRRIFVVVFGVEFVGALLLYLPFARIEGLGRGAFFAVFHSISAFNNAGFGFYNDSLVRFVRDPMVNVTVMLLIILGGLGFMVIINVATHFQEGRRVPLTLHSKVVLAGTAILIAVGTVVILAFEWSNPATLGHLPFPDKLMASLFQSVTPRTAGFNTLDISRLRPATLLFTMLLMFVGGNPGSTAGGIKTVTFLVLVGSAWSVSRGHGELTLFERRVASSTAVKASAIALLGMLLVGAAVTGLTLTDPHKSLLQLGFESISAFGTVGLSTGITAALSAAGKLIIVALMYLGRLGPLTLALALMERQPERRIKYPEDDVVIG
ncbi:MAG TPA: TrkH family potassium uptake protein [Trueperaceae bacterium]|nr:TrkH family potassium uptake protein [Trueperaceae bacterium]